MTAVSTDQDLHAGTGEVSTGRLFARTCAAEWTRLWTVKATWWFVAVATLMMVGLGAIAGFDAASDAVPPQDEPAWVVSHFSAMPAQFALLALVLTAVTSDYATGGIVPALQWTPRRGVFFGARTVVAAGAATGVGLLLALAAALTAFTVARPILALPMDEGIDALATVGFVFAAGTLLAAGLGFLVRNTAGALVTVFLLILILPLLLPQFGYKWLTELADVLPGTNALFLLVEEPRERGMTTTSAVVTMLAWAAGMLVLGWLRLLRDDANR